MIFMPVVSTKPTNDIMATFNALPFEALSMSSPMNAPTNGPTTRPQGGKKKSPAMSPATEPRVACLPPPLRLVSHAGAI